MDPFHTVHPKDFINVLSGVPDSEFDIVDSIESFFFFIQIRSN